MTLSQSLRDELTSLHLRAQFQRDLNILVAAGHCTLLLCDLDHLKTLNDTFGHAAGDEALRAVGLTLRAYLPQGWEAYRLGGDEFAVLASAGGDVVARWSLDLLGTLRQRPRSLRLSMGLATLGEKGVQTADSLRERADARMYSAKRLGRAQLVTSDIRHPFALQDHRLLDRDNELQAVTAFLRSAFLKGGRLRVHAPAGCGLTRFLGHADVVGRHLGYRTLSVSGSPASAQRELGAWASAGLDGSPTDAGPVELAAALKQERGRPLLLILDRPEHFDPATTLQLQPLLEEARTVITGFNEDAGKVQLGETLNLPPLSTETLKAVAASLSPEPLPESVLAWLGQQAQGCPGDLQRWLDALLLEAQLRLLSPAELLAQDDGPQAVTALLPRLYLPSLPPMTGRQDVMREAVRALHSWPVLTLTGPPGRGRTRLARQLLMELQGRLPGGVAALSLQGTHSPGAALARLGEALSGEVVPNADEQLVGRLLARRPILLLIDDVTPDILGAPQLARLIALAPMSRLILTGDAPLNIPQERHLPLAPLTGSQVRGALLSAAGLPATADHPPLDALCAWVQGEPEQLTAAQATLRTLGWPAGAEYLLRQSVQAGHRWAQFGTHERRILTALGGCGAPFSLSLARQLTGASPFMLRALVDQHVLLPVSTGLYALSAGLQTHAQRAVRRAPARHRELTGATLSYAAALVGDAPPGSVTWFQQLDSSWPELRPLLGGLLGSGRADAHRLARLLVTVTPYRAARGQLHDARDELSRALQLSVGDGRAELHVALAGVLQHLGAHAEAEAHADRARRQARTDRLPEVAVRAGLIRARILHRRSQYVQSRQLFQRLQAQVGGHPPELRVMALDGVARSSVFLGDLEVAAAHAQAARTLAAPLSLPLLLADTLNTSALIASETRDLGQAETLFTQALDLHGQVHHHHGITLNLTGLAWNALLAGEFARCAALSRRVLRRAEDSAQRWEIGNALLNLGHAQLAGDLPGNPQDLFRQAREIARQCDAPSLEAEAIGGEAAYLARHGQRAQAQARLHEALAHPGMSAEARAFFAPLIEDLTAAG
ncbi:diguanylate cyclase (plasmid) [Deinococcus aquaticus]|uniref:Diguanylate cyclase n=2 Tax=Deinococcus aquaticus TaxID=328692 RepID=A0ABY7V708_9DEIO|nr:diguanylate cyclase [Deinococcus aquaticus]WDA60414.1 diguanylate cyclase [Deinococcus aquaticus]